MMPFDVSSIRIILALFMLSIASYTDIKKREIDDRLWMVFGGLAAIMLFFTPDIQHYVVTMGFFLIVAPVVLIIWRVGLFGGADAFAMIVLAALAPGSTLSNFQINPFTMLINTILLSVVPIIANVSRNITALARHEDIFRGFENEPRKNKMFAMMVGYRAKNPKFSFSIEKKDGKARMFDFALKNAEEAQFCSSSDTWVTPGIPYMIYILGGFIVQVLYGDIIFNTIGVFS